MIGVELMRRTLPFLLATLALIAGQGCKSPDGDHASREAGEHAGGEEHRSDAVADASLPVVRYYVIADT